MRFERASLGGALRVLVYLAVIATLVVFSQEAPPEAEGMLLVAAALVGIALVVYFLKRFLSLMAAHRDQEDLPEEQLKRLKYDNLADD